MIETQDRRRAAILSGKTALGTELGSARTKAVFIGPNHVPMVSGSHDWENRLEDGIWTYRLEDMWKGLQSCYAKLSVQVEAAYGVPLRSVGVIGSLAMMHGYLIFDNQGWQLAQFRTWRNTTTERAAERPTELFGLNIPQRQSISHPYWVALNGEGHVKDTMSLIILTGHVHWKLTGEKVLGVGDAPRMFPTSSVKNDYDDTRMEQFENLVVEKGYPWKPWDLLPKVLPTGGVAGRLTAEEARLLDPTGTLEPGIPFCPPEGDAGTGMTAINSVAKRAGSTPAGTSIFAMIVLKKPLSAVYPEIDMVTTPTGRPVAMVHCNNCTSDIDAWAELLRGFVSAMGEEYTVPQILDALLYGALEGDADCGGLVSYNYSSGEPVTRFEEDRPLLVRVPGARFTFANLARTHLYTAMVTLKIGIDTLFLKERVQLNILLGYGGFFKATGAGQRLMAAAMGVSIFVMETADEDGPQGMALLAAYLMNREPQESLEEYLECKVLAGNKGSSVAPSPRDVEDFEAFLKRYKRELSIERATVEYLK